MLSVRLLINLGRDRAQRKKETKNYKDCGEFAVSFDIEERRKFMKLSFSKDLNKSFDQIRYHLEIIDAASLKREMFAVRSGVEQLRCQLALFVRCLHCSLDEIIG